MSREDEAATWLGDIVVEPGTGRLYRIVSTGVSAPTDDDVARRSDGFREIPFGLVRGAASPGWPRYRRPDA